MLPITVGSLLKDSFHFLRNQLAHFLILVLLVLGIQYLLGQMINVDFKTMDETYNTNFVELITSEDASKNSELINTLFQRIEQLSSEQHNSFMVDSILLVAPSILANLLLTLWTVSFALMVINTGSGQLLTAMASSLIKFPALILASCLCVIIMAVGLMLYVLPGILLYFALALVPVIICATHQNVFSAILNSGKLLMRYPLIIIAGVLLPILIAMPINRYVPYPIIASFVHAILLVFFTLYFFRFYTLAQSQ